MADLLDNFNSTVNGVLDPIFTNPDIRPILVLALAVYGGLSKTVFPDVLGKYTGNFAIRAVLLALLIWIANRDPAVAIVAATSFMVVLNFAGGKGIFEKFEGPETAVLPACLNMTVYDLLASFNNDKVALMDAMTVARIPGDVKITNYYAPMIATYLVNKGFALNSSCGPPGTVPPAANWI